MSINIGDVNLANEIIDLHYQLRRTQLLLEVALGRIPSAGSPLLTAADMTNADAAALRHVQQKFPNMGIK